MALCLNCVRKKCMDNHKEGDFTDNLHILLNSWFPVAVQQQQLNFLTKSIFSIKKIGIFQTSIKFNPMCSEF